ncbi:HSP20-like chaperones superfamily protein [Abeliophyllum distichum]|uniref:HSP20-like chaperones superfamily protein n=1 Tax=Abeliophyllum distichum TaxID=126358 RepID=A0ABD1VZT5_9LAMI
MDFLRVCNKSKKSFSLHGSDDNCCLPNDYHSYEVLDIHVIELPWLSELSDVMRSAYGPVTTAKTIYDEDEGFCILVSFPFANTGCMPIINRQYITLDQKSMMFVYAFAHFLGVH